MLLSLVGFEVVEVFKQASNPDSNLVQGLALLVASGALGVVNLLASANEIHIQLFHFSL